MGNDDSVIAAWTDDKVKNVRYMVVRLHNLDEERLIKIENDLEEIKRLLKERA